MKLRFGAFFLSLALIMPLTLPVSASTQSVDDILSDFHVEILDAVLERQDGRTVNGVSDNSDNIRHETVQKLQKLGYSAYEVTGSTYDDIQEVLRTDLSALGLKKNCSYVIVVGDDSNRPSQSRSTIGSTYNYTYNGTTYKMRTVKITSADDPNYQQASSVNLLSSHSDSVVQALLDATISAYTSVIGVPKVFGTIASLTGLTKVNLTSSKSTAVFHAGSTWTRTFTQVWDDNFSAWTYGSSIEYVTKVCHINGLKYNSSLDCYEEYTSGKQQDVTKSPHYDSNTWRNEQAIIGLLNAWPVFYDKAGDAYYKYDSRIIVTHREGF